MNGHRTPSADVRLLLRQFGDLLRQGTPSAAQRDALNGLLEPLRGLRDRLVADTTAEALPRPATSRQTERLLDLALRAEWRALEILDDQGATGEPDDLEPARVTLLEQRGRLALRSFRGYDRDLRLALGAMLRRLEHHDSPGTAALHTRIARLFLLDALDAQALAPQDLEHLLRLVDAQRDDIRLDIDAGREDGEALVIDATRGSRPVPVQQTLHGPHTGLRYLHCDGLRAELAASPSPLDAPAPDSPLTLDTSLRQRLSGALAGRSRRLAPRMPCREAQLMQSGIAHLLSSILDPDTPAGADAVCVDHSEDGLAIEVGRCRAGSLQVGEILLLEEPAAGTRQVAEIRWLRYTGDTHLHAGLRRLFAPGIPIAAGRTNGAEVLVLGRPGDGGEALAPPGVLRSGRELLQDGRRYRIAHRLAGNRLVERHAIAAG